MPREPLLFVLAAGALAVGFHYRDRVAAVVNEGVSIVTGNATRAVRNNNPLNIEKGDPWVGLMPEARMNDAQRREGRFAVFISPEYGFRAGVKTLGTYKRRYGVRTVEKAISRWAPAVENHTSDYIANVARAIGVHPKATIDLTNPAVLLPMMREMARVEAGGNFFTDAQIVRGIQLAGVA